MQAQAKAGDLVLLRDLGDEYIFHTTDFGDSGGKLVCRQIDGPAWYTEVHNTADLEVYIKTPVTPETREGPKPQ